MYYRSTGEKLRFVPMYIAPRLKKVLFGEPVTFDPSRPIEEERQRITREMTERITAMAISLPRHRVVPYRNIPKRLYPYNTVSEDKNHETTRG
ncbi:MAG: hypothetical protein IKS07_01295 [Lachnospiraceae bacterium]|nr:hypothetical protein [Lachnospiraceae bacterium]